MVAFIHFVGYPLGAEIFINKEKIGTLPTYYYLLKWGSYFIECKKEGYETETREKFRVFKTDRKKTVYFTLKKKAEEK